MKQVYGIKIHSNTVMDKIFRGAATMRSLKKKKNSIIIEDTAMMQHQLDV